jgi:hypothetical protein
MLKLQQYFMYCRYVLYLSMYCMYLYCNVLYVCMWQYLPTYLRRTTGAGGLAHVNLPEPHHDER